VRTLQICDSIQPNSSEGRRVITISNELSKRGYDVTVASAILNQEEKQEVESCLEPDVEVIWHKPAFRFSNFSYSPSLYKTLCKREFDLIHAHSYRHYGTYVGALLRKKRKIPFVLSPYGSAGYGSSRKFMLLYLIQDLITRKYPLKYADRILANTRYEKDMLIDFGAVSDKIDIVYREVDTKVFNKLDVDFCEDSHTVVFIGRVTPIKGIELIIDSMASTDTNVDLSIIGPIENVSYYKRLLNRVDDQGLQSKVHFHGEIAYRDVAKYCSSAVALVLPSLYENLGGVLLEAQACKCPVIATGVGGVREVVQDGITGYILEKRCSKYLAEIIDNLCCNEELRNRMGSKGREYVLSNFSTEAYMKKIIKSYDKAMNNKL